MRVSLVWLRMAAGVAVVLGLAVARPSTQAPPVLSLKDRDALQNRWLAARFRTGPARGDAPRTDRHVGRHLPRAQRGPRLHHAGPPSVACSRGGSRCSCTSTGERRASSGSTVNPYGSGDLHKAFAGPLHGRVRTGGLDPWQRLARIIKARNPEADRGERVGTFAFADGLSASNKALLVRALGPELAARLVSAERVAVGLARAPVGRGTGLLPPDRRAQPPVVAEAFSRPVITPGVTTIDDLAWWVRERIAELKLGTWFQPMFYISRPRVGRRREPRGPERGDMLRCDIGITYLGLDRRHPAGGLRPAGRRDRRAARGSGTHWPRGTACRTSSCRR